MFPIIKQGLKAQLRQTNWVLFNSLFTIFLMILLGSMLSGAMIDTTEKKSINISYYTEEGNKEIISDMKKHLEGEEINLKEVGSIEEGKDRVEKDREVFLLLEEERIKVYYSDKTIKDGGMVLSFLKSYSDTSSSIKEMYRVNPAKAGELLMDENSFNDEVEISLVKKEDAPNSYQYYGVVELTMMIFYATLFPIGLIGLDRSRNLKERIALSGVSEFKYFIGRIISSFILGIIIFIPGCIFSVFVMGSKWGSNPFLTWSYISAFLLMMVTLGTVVGYLIKQRDKATLFLQGLVIPLLSFLGGAYISLPQDAGGIFEKVTNISPLRWINKGVFQVAYEGKYDYLNVSLIINLGFTLVLLAILYLGLRREKRIS
ncbi:ABC transporter permease [Clostridium paraputrificum]|uniref:ABC transporter permease n=1 Tax=Clostridium paraputrificum TaxID=29363 RepID=UPI003D33BF58